MATRVWTGGAASLAQVVTIAITGWDVTTTYRITRNGKTVSVLGVTSAPVTAAALQVLLAASTIAEFQELTWTVSSSTITGTSTLAGRPCTFTSSVSGGAGTIGAVTISVANGSPSDWANVNNWSPATVPVGQASTPVQSAAALLAGGSLVSGTPYYYVVTATNANGETVVSNERTATPSGGNLSVTLTWTATTGATGYKVYRSTSTGVYGASSLLTTIGSGGTLTYADTGTATSTGTPPGSSTALGDDVVLTQSSVPILYGTQLGYPVLNSLTADASYTGKVGLPEYTGSYAEDRGCYLQVSPLTWTVGNGPGSGTGRFKLDTGTNAHAGTVNNTASPADSGRQSVLLKGANAANTLAVARGSVGVATLPGETATLATLTQSFVSNQAGDATVYLGTGCALTTVTKTGGTLTTQSNVTTLTQVAGTATLLAGTAGTLNVQGGTVYDQSSGAFTTVKVYAGALLERSRSGVAKTYTNATFYKGAKVNDRNGSITFTNPFTVPDGTLSDVAVNLGIGRNYQVS